jgi:phosphohistidine phosphatase
MAVLTLWLLRHAKAVTDPPEDGADFDRVLAPRGRRDAKALGHLIGRQGKQLGLGALPMPELALISPAARTATTADLALAEVKEPPVRQMVPEDVLALLRELPDDVVSAMVVGHNPTAHSLSRVLIAADDQAGQDLAQRRGFPTCALGIYRFDVETWSEVGEHTAHLAGLFIPPFAT